MISPGTCVNASWAADKMTNSYNSGKLNNYIVDRHFLLKSYGVKVQTYKYAIGCPITASLSHSYSLKETRMIVGGISPLQCSQASSLRAL